MEFRKGVRIDVYNHYLGNRFISGRIQCLTKLRTEINLFLGSRGNLNFFFTLSAPVTLLPVFLFCEEGH